MVVVQAKGRYLKPTTMRPSPYQRSVAARYSRGPARPSAAQSFAPIARTSMTQPETKYFDVGINCDITTAGSTWANTEVTCDNFVQVTGSPGAYTGSSLIPSAHGTGYGAVEGIRYKLKKLRVRGHVSRSNVTAQTAVPETVITRLLLVMDTAPNGAQAQGEGVIQDFGESGENLYAFKNTYGESGRFRILKDQMVTLAPRIASNNASASTISAAYDIAQFSFSYKPKVPILVNMKGYSAAQTVANLRNCNIFMLAYAVNESDTAQALTIVGCSRCYFAD